MQTNIFLISDTHFCHSNIITFINNDTGDLIRPFNSVEEMDELMIENWNKTVKVTDKIYHLGDVCFSNRALDKIMPRLNGIKVLIKGNHDNLKPHQYLKYFKDIRAYHLLDKFVLSHIPLHEYSFPRFKGNIHGHTHERSVSDPRYVNVCVEKTNYTPVPFEEILHGM